MTIPHPPIQAREIGDRINMIQRIARSDSTSPAALWPDKDAKLKAMLDQYVKAVESLARYHAHYAHHVDKS